MSNSFVDVLIVGAGPAGLTMALTLARYGISFRIIDKKNQPTQTSNALGVNARTLEVWQNLGLVEDALKQGLPIHKIRYYLDKQDYTISFEQIPSIYPYVLALPQAITEQIYLQHLTQKQFHVERGNTLVAVKNNSDSVSAELKNENGELEVIEAKWLIGCDGYHSVVRDSLEIPYEGQDLTQHFLMVDAKLNTTEQIQEARLVCHPQGLLIILPMRNFVRIIAEVSEDAKWQVVREPTLEIMKAIVEERAPFPINFVEVLWLSAFWVHERVAEYYRKDRVLLVGDAAHAHSPAGGQGMNTGIQDAFNLAWKLALVCQGKANDHLLNSYQMERRPIAQRVVRESGELTKIATINNGWRKWLRSFIFKHVLTRPFIQKKMTSHLAQIDIFYPPHHVRSTIFSEQGKFVLLTSNQQDEVVKQWGNQYSEWLEIRQLGDSTASKKAFSLIRPDMYLAVESNNSADIQSYFQNLFIN